MQRRNGAVEALGLVVSVGGGPTATLSGSPLDVTSVVRNSAGNYTVTLTNAIDRRNQAPFAIAVTAGRAPPVVTVASDTTLTVVTPDLAGTARDTDFIFGVFRGSVGGSSAIPASSAVANGYTPAVAGNWPTVPTSPQAALDSLASQVASLIGGDAKDSVRLASIGAVPAYTGTGTNILTGAAPGFLNDGSGADTFDSVTLVAGNRVLLLNGALGQDNGIYDVTVPGDGATAFVLTRSADASTSAEVTSGLTVPVTAGTTLAGRFYRLTTADPIVLNTTALTFGPLDATYATRAVLAALTNGNGISLLGVEDAAGLFAGTTGEAVLAEVGFTATRANLYARGVESTNVANLAAFAVAGTDGVAGGYLQGDRVLLAGQTAKAENGLYVVGVVAGTAPLTRAPELPTGAVVTGKFVCQVSEGTLFSDTEWKITTDGAITVNTTAHDWYPKSVTSERTLIAGTVTISDIPILSITKSNVLLSRKVANTSALTVGGYHPTTGGANGLTAGVVGTAAAIIEACVAAGTINNADISTLLATVQNW